MPFRHDDYMLGSEPSDRRPEGQHVVRLGHDIHVDRARDDLIAIPIRLAHTATLRAAEPCPMSPMLHDSCCSLLPSSRKPLSCTNSDKSVIVSSPTPREDRPRRAGRPDPVQHRAAPGGRQSPFPCSDWDGPGAGRAPPVVPSTRAQPGELAVGQARRDGCGVRRLDSPGNFRLCRPATEEVTLSQVRALGRTRARF